MTASPMVLWSILENTFDGGGLEEAHVYGEEQRERLRKRRARVD